MVAKSDKVIITCAVTGSIHTPTMSDALPVTPDQIAQQAIAAAEAGAAVLHLHARNPQDGCPTGDPAVFKQFLPRIKQATDAVVNITTGGSVIMTVEERLAAASEFSPEMCSLNMGSMNFALYPMAARYKKWKYDWEEQYLVSSDQNIFRNTFRDIEKISKLMGEGHGTKFEHECYDTGHLYNLAHCVDRGLFKPPIFLQLIFGILGGIGSDVENLMFMKRTADKLFGKLDDVYGTLTGDEVSILTDPFFEMSVPPGSEIKDYALAVGKTRFVGEPVAAVVAATRELARDAAELVEVEYEPLEPLVDARKAQDPDAPILHEEAGSNLVWEGVFDWGDWDSCVAEADRVVRI